MPLAVSVIPPTANVSVALDVSATTQAPLKFRAELAPTNGAALTVPLEFNITNKTSALSGIPTTITLTADDSVKELVKSLDNFTKQKSVVSITSLVDKDPDSTLAKVILAIAPLLSIGLMLLFAVWGSVSDTTLKKNEHAIRDGLIAALLMPLFLYLVRGEIFDPDANIFMVAAVFASGGFAVGVLGANFTEYFKGLFSGKANSANDSN